MPQQKPKSWLIPCHYKLDSPEHPTPAESLNEVVLFRNPVIDKHNVRAELRRTTSFWEWTWHTPLPSLLPGIKLNANFPVFDDYNWPLFFIARNQAMSEVMCLDDVLSRKVAV